MATAVLHLLSNVKIVIQCHQIRFVQSRIHLVLSLNIECFRWWKFLLFDIFSFKKKDQRFGTPCRNPTHAFRCNSLVKQAPDAFHAWLLLSYFLTRSFPFLVFFFSFTSLIFNLLYVSLAVFVFSKWFISLSSCIFVLYPFNLFSFLQSKEIYVIVKG